MKKEKQQLRRFLITASATVLLLAIFSSCGSVKTPASETKKNAEPTAGTDEKTAIVASAMRALLHSESYRAPYQLDFPSIIRLNVYLDDSFDDSKANLWLNNSELDTEIFERVNGQTINFTIVSWDCSYDSIDWSTDRDTIYPLKWFQLISYKENIEAVLETDLNVFRSLSRNDDGQWYCLNTVGHSAEPRYRFEIIKTSGEWVVHRILNWGEVVSIEQMEKDMK